MNGKLRKIAVCALCLPMASCGMLMMPVKAVGGAVRGTANLGRAAVEKPVEAHKKRQAKKEAEKRKKKAREAYARGSGADLGGGTTFGSGPSLGGGRPSLEANDQFLAIPDDRAPNYSTGTTGPPPQ